ncbi:MAG: helix-turn-helix transcriptional regulator [bacterium]|nr:helix-turn-helix transcriptional regulator [bacterium]
MSPLVSTVGRRIRAARYAAGLTQGQLAIAIHKHVNTIRNLERDAYSPTLETLDEIAKACGISRLELIPEHEPALQSA